MNLIEFHKKLRSIDVESLMDRAVLANSEEIIDANTGQLSVGLDATGDFFGEYKDSNYAQFKQSIGSKAPMGVVDLKLTGAFYEGFNIQVEGEGYRVTSRDGKTSDLVSKYGREIFGLTEDSKENLKDQFSSQLTKLIRDALL